ncbi:MAG: tRNA pseudouridine(13) synthase TruD [Myxococcales bacterium]|nr:tRNA pseudouridine(13) synthase TruD [Myxococcales bacterium]
MSRRRLLTETLPGTFRSSVDDFHVEELPLYAPSGTGDHLYVTIRKRGFNTREVVRRLIDAFGVQETDVGYAGLKDRYATTTQTFSVLAKSDAPLQALEDPDIAIVSVTRHGNKLRVGHLEGNRFAARIALGASGLAAATEGLAVLARRGLPNYFGDQRFGKFGDNAALGREVLKKGPRAAGGTWKAKLVISALQSEIFNAVLDRRMAGLDGPGGDPTGPSLIDLALLGDVLQKTGSHGNFVCTAPDVDAPRVTAFEISPTGPLPGPKMRGPAPDSFAARSELAALKDAGLDLRDFDRTRFAEGARRALRVPVSGPSAEVVGDDLWVHFTLPPGSYATVLIDELLGPREELDGDADGSAPESPLDGDVPAASTEE